MKRPRPPVPTPAGAPWGEDQAMSRRAIRLGRKEGVSHTRLARQFHVNKATIKDVDKGRTWKHVA